jgi:hypothetical protein
MKTHVLKGSKQEIADSLVQIAGEVREAIVFVDEPPPAAPDPSATGTQDLFAEMRPYMVDASNVDDSRQALYAPMEGE